MGVMVIEPHLAAVLALGGAFPKLDTAINGNASVIVV